MKTDVPEHAYTANIDQIVGELFQTMLETETSPAQMECQPGGGVITAMVALAGAWKGTLTLECGHAQAVCFARRLMQSEDLHEVNEEVRDALGELANIIAGNLKPALPAGVIIGLPAVIEGEAYSIRNCGARVVGHSAFATDAGPFCVRLIEAEEFF